jgi:hypothetical protein
MGVLAGVCAVTAVARAQDSQPPGILTRFDITQRLEYSDNPDLEVDGDPDFFGRTILNFGLDSVTKIERFSFGLGTNIEEGRDDQSGVEFTNSSATLGYGRETGNASFDVDLRYRESDVSSTFFDEDFDFDSDVINQVDGTRRSYGIAVGTEVGMRDPIGASFLLDYGEINYDSIDPDLEDRSDLDFSGRINFRIDPRIIARLTAKYRDFDTDGTGVDRETTGFGAGVRLDVTQRLVADLSLSYDDITRSGGQTGTNDGLSGTVDLTQEMTNGTLGLSLSSDVSSNDGGRRSFLTVSRDMDLSRNSALAFSLGATSSEATGTDPLFDVSYSHDLKTARLAFGLSQTVRTGSENDERINTTLRVNYDHLINNISSLGFNLAFFDRNALGGTGTDGQRIDVGLTYRHELTRDWGLVGGVSHILSSSDNEADRSSNTIFVGLERNFSWNP